jgi:FkbM family methyltransferase
MGKVIMQTIVRFAYSHRSVLRRLVFIRRPILLKLTDFKIYVRLDDMAVGAGIAVRRGYEKHITRIMRPLLKPGVILVDIGANIGYYTLLAASRIGCDGKVIAFEPSSDNCALLRMSLQANDFDNVKLYPYAVADKEGVVGFEMSDSNGRISPGDALASYQVQAVTLDTCLKDEPHIDIIKMDIEGAEGRALRGMYQLIRRHRPIIFTEFSPHDLKVVSGIAPGVYLSQLRDLGYEIFVVHRSGGQSSTPQSNEQIMGHFARFGGTDHLDLMVCPKEYIEP